MNKAGHNESKGRGNESDNRSLSIQKFRQMVEMHASPTPKVYGFVSMTPKAIYYKEKVMGNATRRRSLFPSVTLLIIAGSVLIAISLMTACLILWLEESYALLAHMREIASFDMYRNWRR